MSKENRPSNAGSLWTTPFGRREMLRRSLIGAAGAAGVALFGNPVLRALAAAAADPVKPAAQGKAKAVIQIWMWGGPCHLDTFDPKPSAGHDYTGPLDHPIATNVPGITIGELLPLLAKQADKYSVIRGMTHGNNAHETASYIVQTGRMPNDRLVYPGAGAVTSLFKGVDAGYRGLVPPYVVMTELQGRFSEAGFLSNRYKPFATGGDPAQKRFEVEGVIASGVTDDRQHARKDLLDKLNTLGNAAKGEPQMAASDLARKQAYDLILGDAGKVFDLSQEKDDLRDRYGRTKFGQSCLMARRLVERGVPYVTINYKGWDTHKQHFQAMNRLLPELDKGFATLLADLADRGLLDSTVVWCGGEFGRTPKVMWEPPWNGGRGHWGNAFSHVLAGGGFKGGRVVGETDSHGETVASRPVSPADLIASIYTQLGIDLNAKLPHPEGLDVRVTPRPEEGVAGGGLLKEIM